MPWKESSQMSSRLEFVLLARQSGANVRALSRQFGVAPATAYKWLKRFEADGEAGLADLSRRPRSSPAQSSPELEDQVLALNSAHPHWGSRKLQALLPARFGTPHHSTIDAILHRHDRCVDHAPGESQAARLRFEHEAPNDLWQMDFKGHFALTGGAAIRCHPLTILDDHSRYSLCLLACPHERFIPVQAALIATFRRYGLPNRMTFDNGPPWGTSGNGTISRLDAWLMRLGVRPSHSRPYHPQTQGKDERFHRTLKHELLSRRGFGSIQSCQNAFDSWRDTYNLVRPHHALGQKPPVTRYRSSNRQYPEVLPCVEYPEGSIVRRVRGNATIKWKGAQLLVGEGLIGQDVELRPSSTDGIFVLYFCDRQIGSLDLRKIE
jgi:transposase InsO family protein